ncbi:MAB_1171c family putative transporter [Nocardia sp. NPDC051321]|uniref:MAB_1171c family putative transporter n=1 Tax=Nocardia sp. NPDC051321 TaxID=3364323 RepID=UPI00378B0525
MTAIPFWLVLSVAVLTAAIVVGRWFLVNDSVTDSLINRALSWYFGATALYGSAAALGMDDLAQRVFLGCGLLIYANLYGFARAVGGGTTHVSRRQHRYDAIAAVAAIVVLTGPPEWLGVVWITSTVAPMVSGTLIARACVRELRTAGLTGAERLAYLGLLAVSLYWSLSSVVMIVRVENGTAPQNPGLAWIAIAFASFVILAALIAVPLIIAVLARTGWDQNGRACRRLRPLWQDLTAMVPEVVLGQDQSAGPGSAARLYRMTVEIRDALLHLRQYAPDLVTEHEVRTRADVSDYALLIAHAARTKAAGGPLTVVDDQPRSVVLPPAHGHDTELWSLLALARAWPTARAAASWDAKVG